MFCSKKNRRADPETNIKKKLYITPTTGGIIENKYQKHFSNTLQNVLSSPFGLPSLLTLHT